MQEGLNSSGIIKENKTPLLPALSLPHYSNPVSSDQLRVNPTSLTVDSQFEVPHGSSDALERARAAIALAQRASAAARSAAELVSSGVHPMSRNMM